LILQYNIVKKSYIRLQIGYIIDFNGNSEWAIKNNDYLYHLQDSPQDNLSGLMLNIGWSNLH
jgi:hypothetical protein